MKHNSRQLVFLIAGLICVIMGVFCLALDYAALVVLAKDHGIIITGIINIVIGVIALAEYLGHKLNYNKAQQGVPPLRATSGARVNADVRVK